MNSEIKALIHKVANSLRVAQNGKNSQASQIDWSTLESDLRELRMKSGMSPSQIAEEIERRNQTTTESVRLPARAWLVIAGATIVAILVSVLLSFIVMRLSSNEFREAVAEYHSQLNHVPMSMTLQLSGMSVEADGKSTVEITTGVVSLLGEAVEDGTEVSFEVIPPEAGTIEPARAATTKGEVTTTFKAGLTPGKAEIHVEAAFGLKRRVSLELKKISAALLEPQIGSDVGKEAPPGSEITYTIQVANKGDASTGNAKLMSTVPTNTTFITATSGGQLIDETSRVQWSVAELQPGGASTYSFVVRVRSDVPPGTVISSGEYWIQHPDGKRVDGIPGTTITVQMPKEL